MGKTEKRKQYITTQANQIMRPIALALDAYTAATDKKMLGKMLFQDKHHRIVSVMRTLDDDYLGKIVACARGEVQGIPDDTRLCDLDCPPPAMTGSGLGMLHYLAALAIEAELVDIIWASMQNAKAEAAKPKKTGEQHYVCPYCTFTTHIESDLFHGVKLSSPYGDGLTPWRKIIFHVALSHEDLARRNQDFGFACQTIQGSEGDSEPDEGHTGAM